MNALTKIDKVLDVLDQFVGPMADGAVSQQAKFPDKRARTVMNYVENSWAGDNGVLEMLKKYISIPNQSPDYDPDIHTNGLQEQACDLLVDWVKEQNVKDLTLRVFKNGNDEMKSVDDDCKRTPLIFMELPASNPDKYKHTVLMYGHFDKQPPLTNDWAKDLGPYKPVIKDGKLYGRGGADDGYSIFASIDCIKALQEQNLEYPRIVILIEGSEESGSPDLGFYRNLLKNDIGEVDYVICLDSGASNYEQLWLTSSLRGVLICTLKVQLLTEGIHSGGSGVVRDSFHVVRELLDRIDSYKDGGQMIEALHTQIPKTHVEFAQECAKALGTEMLSKLPLYKDSETQLVPNNSNDINTVRELLLNQTWRPQLCITGIDGIPNLKGGNVLRKYTTVKLSIRLPPNLDCNIASKIVTDAITSKPLPFNAKVEFESGAHRASGFVCPQFKPWLRDGLKEASQLYFGGKTALFAGVGGTIPLMGNLLELFPTAQFVITGILGPNSNAHGPNEFLHIDYTKRITGCMAHILNVIALKHQQ